MSQDEMKALARRLVDELLNPGDLTKVRDVFGDDCTLYSPAVPVPVQGIEAITGFITGLFHTFPDFHIALEDVLADGDKFVIRSIVSGTFERDFAGIPPTGKHANWNAIGIYRVADGKIVECWEELDLLGGWQRLGVLPAMV